MSYFNPIFRFGISKFAKKATEAGARGFIIPDLPIEEAKKVLAACKKNGLEFIFVVAPNTTNDRLEKIGKVAGRRGWIYCVARLGVTGRQTAFDAGLKKFLIRVRRFTNLPLAVGFGVSKKSDILAIQKAGGNIAVVGSAIIRKYEKGGIKAVEKFMKELANR